MPLALPGSPSAGFVLYLVSKRFTANTGAEQKRALWVLYALLFTQKTKRKKKRLMLLRLLFTLLHTRCPVFVGDSLGMLVSGVLTDPVVTERTTASLRFGGGEQQPAGDPVTGWKSRHVNRASGSHLHVASIHAVMPS